MPLIALTWQETMEALKPFAQRPAVERATGRDLAGGRKMPFANAEGVVAMVLEHLGKECGGARQVGVGAGKAGC